MVKIGSYYPQSGHLNPELTNTCAPLFQAELKTEENTPGTAGGPGGRDRTLAVKSRKNVRKITFFS